ncbi:MAG TPA: amidohydrolase family protein [Thermoanaerobaculia bacterium]
MTSLPILAILAITNITIIDGTGAKPRLHQTLLVDGDRIVSIGKVRVPRGAEVIDGTGKFLVPALWDMHVHLGSYAHAREAFPRMLASGVAGVRDMGTPLDDALRIRREVRSGALEGPRVMTPGPLVQGPLPFKTPLMISVHSREEVDATVRSLRDAGVDFIKVHDALPRDLYFDVARAASHDHIPFAGHIPPSIRASEAAQAGQHSIEHLGGRFHGVLIGCSTRESELMKKIGDVVAAAMTALDEGKEPDDSTIFRAPITGDLVEGFDRAKANALFDEFRRKHIWQVPTLVAQPIRSRSDLTGDDRRYADALINLQKQVVLMMHRRGVRILAGTDSSLDPHALHEELRLLVEAGLTPTEALRSATRDAAEFAGVLTETGTIERGKLADVLIVDADPLLDIANLARVNTVVLRGRRIH